MPPSRKRYNYHQGTLRQQRLQSLQPQHPTNRSQQNQPQAQDEQQQSQQDKQMGYENTSNNARTENKASAKLEVALVKQDTNGNSLGLCDVKDAVHKDIQEVLESDLNCAICREIYINPMILNCAHSFCRYCLNNWLSKQVGCPSCRMVVVFQTENLALKNIVNKMVQMSSSGFQEERQHSLDQRSRAELSQDQGRVLPLMERRSFLPNGGVTLTQCPIIRPWRGPNGATIWRHKLDRSDQVIRPRVGDPGHTDEDDDDDDDDDEDYAIHDDDDIDDSDGPDFEANQSELDDTEGDDDDDDYEASGIEDDPEFDESGSSDIDVDTDESLASSRDRRRNDLNILAGLVEPDEDGDYEIEIEDDDSSSSDDDSSMDDDGSCNASIFDSIGLFSRRHISDATSSDDDDEEDDNSELEPELDMNTTSDSSGSSTEEERELSTEDEVSDY